MMKYIYLEESKLLYDNILDKECKIKYMKKNVRNYFVHIICCQFTSVETLKENWRELVNNVSEVVQKNLKELIEIYNVYIVFFQSNVEEVLLYNIEQNKYSSRKFVISQEMPEDKMELEKIVDSKLFDLKIEKDDKAQFYFVDKMNFISDLTNKNHETEIEKYIEKNAREIINEKN